MNIIHSVSRASWAGLLLAGGDSRRMGSNKAELSCANLKGESLLQHACQQLRAVIDNNFLLGKQPESCPTDFAFIADTALSGGALPALQEFCRNSTFEHLMLIPIDMPLLDAVDLQSLMKLAESSKGKSFICQNQDQQFGFPAVLHNSDFSAIEKVEHRKLFGALKGIGAEVVPANLISSQNLLNVNTPQQWQNFSAMSNND